MEELAVVQSALAASLLGAQKVLVAAVRLGHRVGRALVLAPAPVVQVHLVLNHALEEK